MEGSRRRSELAPCSRLVAGILRGVGGAFVRGRSSEIFRESFRESFLEPFLGELPEAGNIKGLFHTLASFAWSLELRHSVAMMRTPVQSHILWRIFPSLPRNY